MPHTNKAVGIGRIIGMWIFPIASTSCVLIGYCTLIEIAAAWAVQLLFDLVIFILTLWRTVVICKLDHGNLLDIFLRDGELSIFKFFIIADITILFRLCVFWVCHITQSFTVMATKKMIILG